jgi:hypothetical protein
MTHVTEKRKKAEIDSVSGMLNPETRLNGTQLIVSRFDRDAFESPLLRLPPELRNRIYAYASAETIVLGASLAFSWTYTYSTLHSSKSTCSVQLLETCRQVYAEARLLPFANNIIKSPHPAFPRSWKVKPGQKSSIRTVRLGARDRNGKMLLSNRLYSCINVCSGIKCVELSAGGKRTPERLYKTIRRRYPDMDIKMADEALTQKPVRKEC